MSMQPGHIVPGLEPGAATLLRLPAVPAVIAGSAVAGRTAPRAAAQLVLGLPALPLVLLLRHPLGRS